MIKLKKKIPLIDQHDKHGFWGGKFGGSFIPETLRKPIDELTVKFEKLRKDKKDFRFFEIVIECKVLCKNFSIKLFWNRWIIIQKLNNFCVRIKNFWFFKVV